MAKPDKRERLLELKSLQAEIAQLDALETTLRAHLQAKVRRAQVGRLAALHAQSESLSPSGGLYARWQAVLGRLEVRVLELAEAVAEALEGHGDKNLFDLMATANALLDLLERLHQRARVVKEMTLDIQGRTFATSAKLELPETLLLGTPPNTDK